MGIVTREADAVQLRDVDQVAEHTCRLCRRLVRRLVRKSTRARMPFEVWRLRGHALWATQSAPDVVLVRCPACKRGYLLDPLAAPRA